MRLPDFLIFQNYLASSAFTVSRRFFSSISFWIDSMKLSTLLAPSSPAKRLRTETVFSSSSFCPTPACTGSSGSVPRGSCSRSSRNVYPSLHGCQPRSACPELPCCNLRICQRSEESLPVPVPARLGMHREVLDQDTDETLDGTKYNTVNHDRTMFLAVCSGVL